MKKQEQQVTPIKDDAQQAYVILKTGGKYMGSPERITAYQANCRDSVFI